jgi:hypothetical protein
MLEAFRPDDTLVEPGRWSIVFGCGAKFPTRQNAPTAALNITLLNSQRREKDGSFRVVTINTYRRGVARPELANGKLAPCLACPYPKEAGRVENRGMFTRGGRYMDRCLIVSCLARLKIALQERPTAPPGHGGAAA